MKEALLKFKVAHLSKIYNQQIVVRDFSYTFTPGLYLMMGTNGSGKSTTLKMMGGMVEPSNSNFYMDKIKKAFLCERIELLEESPKTYLSWMAKMNHKKENMKELLEKWNIPNKNMARLSKGNKQKCGILSMILTEANLYLFDEPTDALDQEHIKLFKDAIENLLKQNKIVVIATHEKNYFEGMDYHVISFNQN